MMLHGAWRQVERLSGLIQTPIKTLCEDGATAEGVRQDIINSSVNIDKRLTKLYDLIENDILGSLQYGCNYVAPYKVRTEVLPTWTRCRPGSAPCSSSVNGHFALETARSLKFVPSSCADASSSCCPSGTCARLLHCTHQGSASELAGHTLQGESMLRASVAQTVDLRESSPPPGSAAAAGTSAGAASPAPDDVVDLTSSPEPELRDSARRRRRSATDGAAPDLPPCNPQPCPRYRGSLCTGSRCQMFCCRRTVST